MPDLAQASAPAVLPGGPRVRLRAARLAERRATRPGGRLGLTGTGTVCGRVPRQGLASLKRLPGSRKEESDRAGEQAAGLISTGETRSPPHAATFSLFDGDLCTFVGSLSAPRWHSERLARSGEAVMEMVISDAHGETVRN